MRARAISPSPRRRRRSRSTTTAAAGASRSASGGITPVPLRLDAVADALVGSRAEEAITRDAVRAALADIELLSDLHASADYRRRAAATLAVRAITDAYRAAEGAHAG